MCCMCLTLIFWQKATRTHTHTHTHHHHHHIYRCFFSLRISIPSFIISSSAEDGVSCPLDAPAEVKLSLPTWAKHYDFSGPLRPCLQSPRRTVPDHIRKTDYATHPSGVSESEQRDKTSHKNIRVYSQDEVEAEFGLRHACQMGREVLDVAGKALRPGVSTDEIDRSVHEACLERNCYPSPLNYYQFPKSVCTSVNEVICHGIPDYREIQDGGELLLLSSSLHATHCGE